jgi:hypothetical protein
MRLRKSFLFLFLCELFLQTGCAVLEPMNEMTRQTLRLMKPNPNDYRDPTEEEDSNWEFVGQLGRGDRLREKDTDSWWGKYIMSEKARSIERNFGIDH